MDEYVYVCCHIFEHLFSSVFQWWPWQKLLSPLLINFILKVHKNVWFPCWVGFIIQVDGSILNVFLWYFSQVVAILQKFYSHSESALGLSFISELIVRFRHCAKWVGRQAFAFICQVSTAWGESPLGLCCCGLIPDAPDTESQPWNTSWEFGDQWTEPLYLTGDCDCPSQAGWLAQGYPTHLCIRPTIDVDWMPPVCQACSRSCRQRVNKLLLSQHLWSGEVRVRPRALPLPCPVQSCGHHCTCLQPAAWEGRWGEEQSNRLGQRLLNPSEVKFMSACPASLVTLSLSVLEVVWVRFGGGWWLPFRGCLCMPGCSSSIHLILGGKIGRVSSMSHPCTLRPVV